MTAPLSMSVEEWQALVNKCIAQGDVEGVGHALRLMVLDKPREADELFQTLRIGLRIAKADRS